MPAPEPGRASGREPDAAASSGERAAARPLRRPARLRRAPSRAG